MKNDPHYKYEPLNRNISSVTQLLSQIEGDKNITHRSHATDFVSLIILLPPPPPSPPSIRFRGTSCGTHSLATVCYRPMPGECTLVGVGGRGVRFVASTRRLSSGYDHCQHQPLHMLTITNNTMPGRL